MLLATKRYHSSESRRDDAPCMSTTCTCGEVLRCRRGRCFACLAELCGDEIDAVTGCCNIRAATHPVSDDIQAVGASATALEGGAAASQPRRHGEGGGGLCVLT